MALAAIERLKSERVVTHYEIGGAMAPVFWTEPIPNFDLDVFAVLPSKSPLVSLVAFESRMRYQLLPTK